MAKPAGRKRGPVLSTLLPAKHAGRHRWIVNMILPLTAEQAAAVSGGAELNVDPVKLVALNFCVCLDCDQSYTDARMQPCPAEDAYDTLSWPSPPTQGAS